MRYAKEAMLDMARSNVIVKERIGFAQVADGTIITIPITVDMGGPLRKKKDG